MPATRTKTTSTWFKRTTVILARTARESRSKRVQDACAREADWLLQQTFSATTVLADFVPEDRLDEWYRRAKDFTERLNDRRLHGKLSNTTGRTPEEAALFEEAAKCRNRRRRP
jgi:hypothetical protein